MIKFPHLIGDLNIHFLDWKAVSIPSFLIIILILIAPAGYGRANTASPLPTGSSESILPSPVVAEPSIPAETNTSLPTTPVPSVVLDVTATAEKPTFEFPPGDHALDMVYDGIERTYVVHIPLGLDPSEPVPLILAFHGLGLNATEMMRISGFNAQSDSSGFIIVYPEGTGETRSWNGGHCCGTAARDRVDDAGFVRALIAELEAALPIDPKQIHATGFSNGAIFSYRLACELADVIASFGPVSATPAEEDMLTCNPARPVPIMHYHGTADDPNPYNGGEAPAGYVFMSVAETMNWWKEYNSCPSPPQTTESGSIKHDAYSPCASASDLELYTIQSGKHAWPGGEAVNLKMGLPNMEIHATSLMWEFFASHPMP